jgi:hypothetical protein
MKCNMQWSCNRGMPYPVVDPAESMAEEKAAQTYPGPRCEAPIPKICNTKHIFNDQHVLGLTLQVCMPCISYLHQCLVLVMLHGTALPMSYCMSHKDPSYQVPCRSAICECDGAQTANL